MTRPSDAPRRSWIVLPNAITEHERVYLARMHRIALVFFFAHVPALALVGFLNRTGALWAAAFGTLAASVPLVALRALANPRQVGRVMAVVAMGLGGLLVHFGSGPLQIEMHFYFFVLLALLSVFADPVAIVVGAVAALIHHAVLWFVYPASVFNYEASVWWLVIHGTVVLLEAIAACFVARTFYDNVVGLETTIVSRTAALRRRTDDLKLILDNMGQGFLAFDDEGIIFDEHSAMVETWLGPPPVNRRVVDWFRSRSSTAGLQLELGLDALRERTFPAALLIEQFPRRIAFGGRVLAVDYHPTGHGIVTVLSDVTAAEEAKRLESGRAATLLVVESLLRDREGFLEFFAEAEHLAAVIFDRGRSPVERRRAIHTMKGNGALFGLTAIAEACSAIEEDGEHDSPLEEADVTRLRELWSEAESNVWRLAGIANDERIRISRGELDLLLSLVRSGARRTEIEAALSDLELDSVEEHLTRLAEQARHLALHLARAPLDVVVHTTPIRVPREEWAPIWTALVHVVRNAVDHGLETEVERTEVGKAAHAHLTLRARVDGDDVYCELADDGRGIDWDKVARRAAARGLPHLTSGDLHEALFADGLTTKEVASTLSGRGIGMGAVRAACRALGGEVIVDSDAGRGTRVRLRVPRRAPASDRRPTLRPRLRESVG